MTIRRLRLPLILLAATMLSANIAWALGFGLGETKEELKLDYQVEVTDHGTGRVTVVFTLADEGRLKPLQSVDLVIPSEDGSNHVDMSLSLALREEDGKQVARIHLLKTLAERAEIQLKTRHIDGKEELLTWYYHSIPLAEYLKIVEPKKE